MVETFPVYYHFFTIIKLSLTSKKDFEKQCSLIDNGSTLPSLLPLITEKSFSVEDIKNIIRKLDSDKAHGGDMISIRMRKLCDKSTCKPLNIIFKSCLTQSIFPSEWEKANVVPIHKKNRQAMC